MPCNYKYAQIGTLNRALREVLPTPSTALKPVYDALAYYRSQLLAEIMPATPRVSLLLRTIIGLSPGHVRVWLDTERGWIAEGVKEPGSHPEYHLVTEPEAKDLLSEHPTPALAHRMMEPDPYVGE